VRDDILERTASLLWLLDRRFRTPAIVDKHLEILRQKQLLLTIKFWLHGERHS